VAGFFTAPEVAASALVLIWRFITQASSVRILSIEEYVRGIVLLDLLPLLNAVDGKHGKPSHGCAWIGERLSECGQRPFCDRADFPQRNARAVARSFITISQQSDQRRNRLRCLRANLADGLCCPCAHITITVTERRNKRA
jgi:hypothetical protein